MKFDTLKIFYSKPCFSWSDFIMAIVFTSLYYSNYTVIGWVLVFIVSVLHYSFTHKFLNTNYKVVEKE